MKTLPILSILLLIGFACSRPPVIPHNLYSVTGMLNDSVWFATGQAVEQTDPLPEPCISHRFDLFIRTDIPYPGFPEKDPVTGCIDNCRASQWLTLFNVPLKKGKYKIAKLDRCGLPFNYHYAWIGYAGGLIMPFQIKNSRQSWVRVTSFDTTTRLIQGHFRGNFMDSTGRAARFERGTFKVELQSSNKVAGD